MKPKRDRGGRFVKTKKGRGRRVRNPVPSLPIKVAFASDNVPIAAFRSIVRARQYGKALAYLSKRNVRLLNPAGTRVARCVRKVSRRPGARSPIAVCQAATRQSYRTGLRLKNPKGSSRSGLGSSGKYYVTAAPKRPGKKWHGRAWMGWHDDALETRKLDAIGFSTKAIAHSEAKRMASLWPDYVWAVER